VSTPKEEVIEAEGEGEGVGVSGSAAVANGRTRGDFAYSTLKHAMVEMPVRIVSVQR